MTSLKIEITNPTDVQLFIAFAKRLNAKVTQLKNDSDLAPTHWLEQLAKVNAFAEIDDPLEWQRQNRIDRDLPMR